MLQKKNSLLHQSFNDVYCSNCGTKTVGKAGGACPKCGTTGMIAKSVDELTNKTVNDSDLFK